MRDRLDTFTAAVAGFSAGDQIARFQWTGNHDHAWIAALCAVYALTLAWKSWRRP